MPLDGCECPGRRAGAQEMVLELRRNSSPSSGSAYSGPKASHLPSLVMTVWLPNEEDGQDDFRGLRHLMGWVSGEDREDGHS